MSIDSSCVYCPYFPYLDGYQWPSPTTYSALCVDVSNVGGNTWATLDIVKGELADPWVQLEEKRQRLANATACAEYDDLGEL